MATWSVTDIEMMARAIKIAKQGYYTSAPNPCVGCVIVKDNQIVGEGFHQQAGHAHAEVNALNMAGKKAEGATAYVTLEPCSHFGRTPPCARALIHAQLKRVVVAMIDPNPKVAGNGIKMLEQHGIDVESGLLAQQACKLNSGFITRMSTQRPFVTVKIAASIDGKTALSNGVSKWITGKAARQDVQRLRASHGALVTGIETIIADNPTLNVRYQQLGELTHSISPEQINQPLRVVLDSNARLELDNASNLFAFKSPILLVSCKAYPKEQTSLWPEHVSSIQLDADNGRVNLNNLFEFLADKVNSVLIEAGATLAGSVIEQKLANELILYQAPKILGNHGRNLIHLADYKSMDELPKMTLIEQRKVGADNKFTFSFSNKVSH